jgi:threonyl-tRNA synthetase
MAVDRGKGEEAGPAVRDPSAQREDQLQGAERSLARIPALIAVGRKEASENTVSVRRLGSNAQSTMGADEAIAALTKEAMPPDLRKAG